MIIEEQWVVAENGKRVYARSAYPQKQELPFYTVIAVPGGLGSGTPFLDESRAERLVSAGYAVVTFNPQGRGTGTPGDLQSEGTEDYNGYIHQDDLRSLITTAGDWPFVDPEQIGLVSSSYGISMAAGCLGRHRELKVRFLVDIEGPSDSPVVMCDPWLNRTTESERPEAVRMLFRRSSAKRDPSPSNSDWWKEREALRYIGSVRAPYLRLQAFWDHMQPPSRDYPDGFDRPPDWYRNKHAVDMINAATNGASPWTRMNDSRIGNMPGMLYSHEKQPLYYHGAFDFRSDDFSDVIGTAVDEMFSLTLE